VTLVATSAMVSESIKASEILHSLGIDAELIDLRSVKPWDHDLVLSSVGKTGRLVIADAAWMTGSIAAEIAATVAGHVFHALKAPIFRVCLPDVPAPTSGALEAAYYIGADEIVAAVQKVLH
jgi:pyruvate dehydrogenase E1 component beta subunit